LGYGFAKMAARIGRERNQRLAGIDRRRAGVAV